VNQFSREALVLFAPSQKNDAPAHVKVNQHLSARVAEKREWILIVLYFNERVLPILVFHTFGQLVLFFDRVI
jgi:hypothetical protein